MDNWGFAMIELDRLGDTYEDTECEDDTSIQVAGYYDHTRDEVYALTKYVTGPYGGPSNIYSRHRQSELN